MEFTFVGSDVDGVKLSGCVCFETGSEAGILFDEGGFDPCVDGVELGIFRSFEFVSWHNGSWSLNSGP